MRLWRYDIYDVHILVHGPALLDLLNIGDILLENIVFSHDIVYDLSTVLVEHEDFPFSSGSVFDGVEDQITLDLKHGENHFCGVSMLPARDSRPLQGERKCVRIWEVERDSGWLGSRE